MCSGNSSWFQISRNNYLSSQAVSSKATKELYIYIYIYNTYSLWSLLSIWIWPSIWEIMALPLRYPANTDLSRYRSTIYFVSYPRKNCCQLLIDILFWLNSSVLICSVLDNSSLHRVRKQGLFIILIPHPPEFKFRKYIPILGFPEIISF